MLSAALQKNGLTEEQAMQYANQIHGDQNMMPSNNSSMAGLTNNTGTQEASPSLPLPSLQNFGKQLFYGDQAQQQHPPVLNSSNGGTSQGVPTMNNGTAQNAPVNMNLSTQLNTNETPAPPMIPSSNNSTSAYATATTNTTTTNNNNSNTSSQTQVNSISPGYHLGTNNTNNFNNNIAKPPLPSTRFQSVSEHSTGGTTSSFQNGYYNGVNNYSPNDANNQAGYASDVSSGTSITTPNGAHILRARRLYQSKDVNHPSLNGTPEELDYDTTGVVDTGVDVSVVKEDMIESWNAVMERTSKRLELLESEPVGKLPTYETDVISQGLITVEEAEERINNYKEKFIETYPIVILPEMTLDQFRRDNPILFLAVMAVSSIMRKDHADMDKYILLQNKAVEAVIYATMMVGIKSFELLQSIILLTFWYNEPEVHCHQKYHLLVNLAVSIATDLGLNGSTVDTSKGHAAVKYESVIRPQTLVDPKTVECRMLWLAVYCCTINFTNVIRRPMYSLWSSYMEECCEEVENADIPALQKQIAPFARMTRIFEEVSKAFWTESGSSPPDVEDSRTSFLINYFEQRLIDLYKEAYVPKFEPYFHAIQIYVHQSALYLPLSQKLGRSPFSEFSLAIGMEKCSHEVVNCASWCYSSAVKCLDLVNRLNIGEMSILPVITFTRLAFCVSTLLKLRTLALTSPVFYKSCPIEASCLNRVFDVRKKIDEVIQKYPFCNRAVTFKFVVNLLLFNFDRIITDYVTKDQKQQQGGGPNDTTTKPVNKRLSVVGNDNVSTNRTNSNNNNGNTEADPNQPQGNGDNKSNMPGSPLEILSSVAVSGAQENDSTANSQQTGYNNGAKALNTYPMATTAQDDMGPNWLLTDDFWKDLVPNVEAFMGYDIM